MTWPTAFVMAAFLGLTAWICRGILWVTDEPSAEALPIWAVNRAAEIASTFEYALNIWERDAIAREIDAAYRRGWERGREDAKKAVQDFAYAKRDEGFRVSDLGATITSLAPPQEGS